MSKVAIFPGSFDPFTKGHEDLVRRGRLLFSKVIIAIGHNTKKTRYFELEDMLVKIQSVFEDDLNVEVVSYNELTASFAVKNGAGFLLRGLRNTTDFEYENSIAQINKNLNDSLDSVFLITSPEYAFVNSSVLREVHRYGGDISEYLPYKL